MEMLKYTADMFYPSAVGIVLLNAFNALKQMFLGTRLKVVGIYLLYSILCFLVLDNFFAASLDLFSCDKRYIAIICMIVLFFVMTYSLVAFMSISFIKRDDRIGSFIRLSAPYVKELLTETTEIKKDVGIILSVEIFWMTSFFLVILLINVVKLDYETGCKSDAVPFFSSWLLSVYSVSFAAQISFRDAIKNCRRKLGLTGDFHVQWYE